VRETEAGGPPFFSAGRRQTPSVKNADGIKNTFLVTISAMVRKNGRFSEPPLLCPETV